MKINDLFYLESYIITETKKKKFILINTLDGSFMTFEYSNSLKRVVDELLKDGNNYCIKITKEHLEDRYIKIFIEETKKKYFSDTIDSKITLSKPFIAQPIKNYQTDINRIEKQTLLYGGNITSKLNELTIFINSYCNLDNPIQSLPTIPDKCCH